MRLCQLSSLRRARDFDGGYGLANSGRWNSMVPCSLHWKNAYTSLTPTCCRFRPTFGQLPNDWALRETHTQALGDAWLDGRTHSRSSFLHDIDRKRARSQRAD
jgi:hypothetical protein